MTGGKGRDIIYGSTGLVLITSIWLELKMK